MLCGSGATMAKDVKKVLEEEFKLDLAHLMKEGKFQKEEWG